MADNVGYTPGSGAIVAADDIGGVLHQRVKLALGADGTNDGDLSATNPMPVTGSVAVTTAVPLDVTASTPLEVTASTPLDVDVTNVIEVLREELPQDVEVEALPPIPIRVDSPDWSAYLRQLSDIEQQLRIVRERLAEQDDEEVLLLL